LIFFVIHNFAKNRKTMEQPNLGRRISEFRKAKGLTQQELAEQCKVSARTMQRIENGVVTPRTYTVRAIFAALGCDFPEKDNSFMSIHFERVCNYLKNLFNLKINTMKKVSILTVAVLAIGFGFFALCPKSNAQKISNAEHVSAANSNLSTVSTTALAGQITMTLQPEGVVSIRMAGSENVTIDWGDGTASEMYALTAHNEKSNLMDNRHDIKYGDEYLYSHDYSGILSHVTITIVGENITFLGCSFLKLTSLDVSRNTALIYLHCSNNQLTSLDVSKNIVLKHLVCDQNQLMNLDVSSNTALTKLNCVANQLTSLDVSKNTALMTLLCADNQLTSLDVSRNTTLWMIWCFNNQLSTAALNFLFETLHDNGKHRRIFIGNNPGEAYNQSIATSKGWTVDNFFSMAD